MRAVRLLKATIIISKGKNFTVELGKVYKLSGHQHRCLVVDILVYPASHKYVMCVWVCVSEGEQGWVKIRNVIFFFLKNNHPFAPLHYPSTKMVYSCSPHRITLILNNLHRLSGVIWCVWIVFWQCHFFLYVGRPFHTAILCKNSLNRANAWCYQFAIIVGVFSHTFATFHHVLTIFYIFFFL